jgi:hypothetical protein
MGKDTNTDNRRGGAEPRWQQEKADTGRTRGGAGQTAPAGQPPAGAESDPQEMDRQTAERRRRQKDRDPAEGGPVAEDSGQGAIGSE